MADNVTKEKRSQIMSRIKGKDTRPEIIVRRLIHSMGYRFSLHKSSLPGTPDIVLRKYKTVIFVHGCFWHQHPGYKRATMPKSNVEYWERKLKRNVNKFAEQERQLNELGLKVAVVWECQTKDKNELSIIINEQIKGVEHEV